MCWYFQYVHFVHVWIISQHLELVKENKKCNFAQRLKDWESCLGVSHTESFNGPTNRLQGLWADVLQGDRGPSCRPCLNSLWQSQRWIGSCQLWLHLRMAHQGALARDAQGFVYSADNKGHRLLCFSGYTSMLAKGIKVPFLSPLYLQFYFPDSLLLLQEKPCTCPTCDVSSRPSQAIGSEAKCLCNLILFCFLLLGRFRFPASVIWEWPCDFLWRRKCEWKWWFGETCLVAGSQTLALPSNQGDLDSVSGYVYYCISPEGQRPQRGAADSPGETNLCYVDDISGWWLLQIWWLIWMKALISYISRKGI